MRIAGAANRNRLQGLAVTTDLAAHPSLYTLLLHRIDDPDPAVRRDLVTALVGYYIPQREDLERTLIARIASEQSAGVRARMVLGLGERAKGGSEPALRQVMSAFDDPTTEVRLASTTAISTMAGRGAVPPDAVARMVQQLSAPEDYVRLATIRGLDRMGPAVKPHIPTLQVRLGEEKDEKIRAELMKLLDRLRSSKKPSGLCS